MTRFLSGTAFGVAAVALGLLLPGGAPVAQPMNIQPPKQPVVRQARPLPLPPARPPELGGNRAASAPAPAPAQVASATPPTVITATGQPVAEARSGARPAKPATAEEAVERLNSYFNSFNTLQGDFIQFAADGRRFEGKLYVHRPGKMRFEYQPPVTMEVVADGTSVAIRDRKLATQDLYSIGQTPLKFLLKERIDLARDSVVTGSSIKGDVLSMRLEDRSTLGGTSKITLNFDLAANELRQWIVVDPQGYETSVSLYNLDTQRRPDPKRFVINYERVL